MNKRTVIVLKNLDPESETYRIYKQLNCTYKYHARPHGSLGGHAPAALACLKGKRLYPDMWVELLRQAA